MNSKKGSSLANLASALAVALSLVFVGFEIRQNTVAQQSATLEGVFSQRNDFNLATLADDGMVSLAYDPGIAAVFSMGEITDVDLWSLWDSVPCPVLVLRGESSDLLTPEVAGQMVERGHNVRLVEIPGCGHAPALMDDDQIAIVRDWLNA